MGSFLDKPIETKHSKYEQGVLYGRNLSYGVSHMQGWRVSMEDAHIHQIGVGDFQDLAAFGVFDGHGGSMVANYVQDNLINEIIDCPEFKEITEPGSKQSAMKIGEAVRKSFLSLDAKIRQLEAVQKQQDHSGSTGVMVFITPTHYIVANCGDSRLIIASTTQVRFATLDHKPTNAGEQARIENAGGYVSFKRVGGDLAVSRAFGDFVYKANTSIPDVEQMVSVEPEISIIERNHKDDLFITVACDGIWDVMSNADVRQFCLREMKNGYPLDYICELLLDSCLKIGSRDNMSAIVVALPAYTPPTKERPVQQPSCIDTSTKEDSVSGASGEGASAKSGTREDTDAMTGTSEGASATTGTNEGAGISSAKESNMQID